MDNNYNNNTPYRATRNMNTAINNPTASINDTMNVNIQSVDVKSNNNIDSSINLKDYNSGIATTNNTTPIPNNSAVGNPTVNSNSNSSSNTVNESVGKEENSRVEYVTMNNKPKKKSISINLGAEFKIALLIVVILLVFILLMPTITDLFKPH